MLMIMRLILSMGASGLLIDAVGAGDTRRAWGRLLCWMLLAFPRCFGIVSDTVCIGERVRYCITPVALEGG